jgi:hypothetical protein
VKQTKQEWPPSEIRLTHLPHRLLTVEQHNSADLGTHSTVERNMQMPHYQCEAYRGRVLARTQEADRGKAYQRHGFGCPDRREDDLADGE